MSERISFEEFTLLLEDTFGRGQELTFTPSGCSMKPMLDGESDKVTFSPKPERLKKYDVAFYRRPSTGQLVLHRMVGFTPDGGYIFCGDNQYALEYGITDDDVLALMTAYTHGGRERSVHSLRYRLYSRAIVLRRKSRRSLSKLYHKLKRS